MDAIMLSAQEGDSLWTMGMLFTIKAHAEDTGGEFAAMEVHMPSGAAPPLHIHHNETEINYLIEGELRYRCGETVRDCGAGSFIYLPKGVPHAFKAGPNGARMLALVLPGGLERLYALVGEPAQTLELPASPPEVAAWLEHAKSFGLEIIGPPLD